MIRKKIVELAKLVHGELLGDGTLEIHGVADLAEAEAGTISYYADTKKSQLLELSNASVVVVPLDYLGDRSPIIRVKDPVLAITLIHNAFLQVPFSASGISPQASVAQKIRIPQKVSIGPKAVLAQGVTLGERVTIHPGVVVGENVTIGDDCILYPNVTIYPGCQLGNRVIIHSGSVIGADGFGYVTTSEGRHIKRPHVGRVKIDDDVEIGANVCIDRSTFGETWIQKGTKIDNLVQIGHNVVLGESCLVVGQAGIAGSTTLGRNVVLGGQVAVTGHISLGDRVMVAGQSGVIGHVASNTTVSGTPAIPHRKWLRASSAFSMLPDLRKDVRKIKTQLAELLSNK